MRPRIHVFACALIVLVGTWPAAGAAPGVYAITGGTVHPVSRPQIAGGTVIIRDGLIEYVGSEKTLPADATVIDAKGLHVYPGLFDAQTSVGMPAAPKRPTGSPFDPQTPPPPPSSGPKLSPAFVAAQNMNITEDALESKRATGVTTVLAAASGDIFNGQSVIFNLSGESPAAMIVKTPASFQVAFNPRPAWTYPDSLMGVISHIRQSFLDAQHFAQATATYERDPLGRKRSAPDPSLQELGRALRRDLPVIFVADSELTMRRAAAIAKEFNLRLVIAGGRQGYKMADELKAIGAPVLVSTNFPLAPKEQRDREDQPLRLIRDRQLAPTTPAELARRKIPFALVSGTSPTAADFIKGIRKTIDNGLSEQDALRAVTLSPAEILGVDRQIGSLDRGKIANVFVSDKKFFERNTKVKHLFIDGRLIRLPKEEDKKADAGAAASVADGTWNLSIQSAEGEVAIQVTLRSEGNRVSGSYAGDRGSGEISGGSLEGSNVRFTINMKSTPSGEASDWAFSGTISGSSMQGTVSTTIGTFSFSGSKSK